jgi:hypothetical protein
MAKTAPGRAVRFALEAGAIFLGVTLGFLADDYRDYLNDRSLEQESLQQVIDDLKLDHDDMAPMVPQTQTIAELTRWISNHAASGRTEPDSFSMALDSLYGTGVFWYEPVATAYSGLKSTGRIDLIQDPGLKNAIVHYFEDRQPLIVTLNRVWQDANRRWRDNAAAHIDVLETDLTQAFPDVRIADVAAFASDRVAVVSASELTGHSLDLQGYVVDVLALNEALAARVEEYLASKQVGTV